MKDTDLHIHPKDYLDIYNCTGEHEASCGTSEGLYKKLEYIDKELAEYEKLLYIVESRIPYPHNAVFLSGIKNLTLWYQIVYDELLTRKQHGQVYG